MSKSKKQPSVKILSGICVATAPRHVAVSFFAIPMNLRSEMVDDLRGQVILSTLSLP